MGKRAVESGPGLLLYSYTSTHALGQRRWIGGKTKYSTRLLLTLLLLSRSCSWSCLGLACSLQLHRKVKTRSGHPWRRYRLPPFRLSAVHESGGGKSGDDSVVPQRNSSTDHRELHIFLPVTYWDLREIPMGWLLRLGLFLQGVKPSQSPFQGAHYSACTFFVESHLSWTLDPRR